MFHYENSPYASVGGGGGVFRPMSCWTYWQDKVLFWQMSQRQPKKKFFKLLLCWLYFNPHFKLEAYLLLICRFLFRFFSLIFYLSIYLFRKSKYHQWTWLPAFLQAPLFVKCFHLRFNFSCNFSFILWARIFSCVLRLGNGQFWRVFSSSASPLLSPCF